MKNCYTLHKLIRKIFAKDIQSSISNIPLLKDCIHSFLLYFQEENMKIIRIEFCFELRATLSDLELEVIHNETYALILEEMKKLNQGFQSIINSLADPNQTCFGFYSLGEGPFKNTVIGSFVKPQR
ncbi:MAG: hypothetical protein H0W61_04220 [Bacteroidetes bacterium]|nr:hypothetical protein [Bacteroidota bacterium]